MAGSKPPKYVPTSFPSPARLWAEQLALGLALLVGLLIFMACVYPKALLAGADVLTTGYLPAYGWLSVLGIFLHFIIHEAGAFLAARWMKLPFRFRLFPLGANANAMLEDQPRQVGRDAFVGFAGPVTGVAASMLCAGIYEVTHNPFFLGMACLGYFYNLLTLVPILDLEGGWIAPAIAPQAWLLGLFASVVELTYNFNLVLLGLVSLGVPRLFLLICARAPRTDLECTTRQRVVFGLGYFLLVITLAWLGSTTYVALTHLVPEAMGD